MIHFFRKIRQKLIKEQKLRTYLTYAIGEISLVVIGIILALQFSNWNQKKAEIKKEIWYLDNMANDMFNQQEELKDLKTYYTDAIFISESILSDYKRNLSFKEVDSLSSKINQLLISDPFPNVDNTYRELVSSGQVALIENDSLVLDIIDFYIYNDKLENIFKTTQEEIFFGSIYPILNKFAAIDISGYTENEDVIFEDETVNNYILKALENPKNKLELINAIKNKIIITTQYREDISESLKMIDTMINYIDDEIDLLE